MFYVGQCDTCMCSNTLISPRILSARSMEDGLGVFHKSNLNINFKDNMTITVLTGTPGVRKTTAVISVAQKLQERRVRVRGIVSRELRDNYRKRIGFEFIDLITSERSILASITGNGPRVGKYFVNLEGCRFAAERLLNAIDNSDVIVCDEIAPMELKSREFIESARNVDKKVIVVIHQMLQHPLIEEFI